MVTVVGAVVTVVGAVVTVVGAVVTGGAVGCGGGTGAHESPVMVVVVAGMHQVRPVTSGAAYWHCVILVARVRCIVIVLTRRTRGRIESV